MRSLLVLIVCTLLIVAVCPIISQTSQIPQILDRQSNFQYSHLIDDLVVPQDPGSGEGGSGLT
jgi:hypothetical protein